MPLFFNNSSPHPSEVFLNEPWTKMHVDLYKRRVPHCLETVHLTRLDHKNVSRAPLECPAVHRPHSSSFANKLDLIIRMPMRSRSRTRFPIKQKDRNARPSLLLPHKLVRTPHKRQVLLPHMMHARLTLHPHWMSEPTRRFSNPRAPRTQVLNASARTTPTKCTGRRSAHGEALRACSPPNAEISLGPPLVRLCRPARKIRFRRPYLQRRKGWLLLVHMPL